MTKFNIAHFPVGTIFEINHDVHFRGEVQTVFTVGCIHRNGVDSYVLETTALNESFSKYTKREMMHSYNISHVKRIIKRGDGPVCVDHNRYGLGTQAI